MKKSTISRRGFIQRTAGTLGATVLARSAVLGSGPAAVALRAADPTSVPSDTVRFGMVGVGGRGAGLLETSIHLPGVECAGACDLYEGRRTLAQEILSAKPVPKYGQGTNVLCKACKQRKIFIEGPHAVSIEDDKVYLSLTCPSPVCNQTRKYEENELEIH